MADAGDLFEFLGPMDGIPTARRPAGILYISDSDGEDDYPSVPGCAPPAALASGSGRFSPRRPLASPGRDRRAQTSALPAVSAAPPSKSSGRTVDSGFGGSGGMLATSLPKVLDDGDCQDEWDDADWDDDARVTLAPLVDLREADELSTLVSHAAMTAAVGSVAAPVLKPLIEFKREAVHPPLDEPRSMLGLLFEREHQLYAVVAERASQRRERLNMPPRIYAHDRQSAFAQVVA